MKESNQQDTYDFYRRVLDGDPISEADLSEMLATRIAESQFLEFKDAAWVLPDESKKAAGRYGPGHPEKFEAKLKKYIAGFANSEGGLLVVGVKEPAEDHASYTLAPISDSRALKTASSRNIEKAVHRLGPNLIPVPRIQRLETEAGVVVLVAVDRGYHLVPCYESGQWLHYWRIFDSTLHAPQFLVQDMVLGRRRRPVVEVQADWWHPERGRLMPLITVRNASTIWMDDVTVAVVWIGSGNTDLPPEFSSRVRLTPRGSGPRLVHEISPPEQRCTIAPFTKTTFRFRLGPKISLDATPTIRAAFAVIVLARDQPPTGFQVKLEASVGESSRTNAQGTSRQASGEILVGLSRFVGGAWDKGKWWDGTDM